jgi:hypothetical protein
MSAASCACETFGTLTNGGNLVEYAIQGAIGLALGYQTIGSPQTTLQETWKTLIDIRTHLKAVTPERRQKIEAAAAMKQCRSLLDIEKELQEYVSFTHLTHLRIV